MRPLKQKLSNLCDLKVSLSKLKKESRLLEIDSKPIKILADWKVHQQGDNRITKKSILKSLSTNKTICF